MKKICGIIVLCLIALPGFSQLKKFQDIIGRWEFAGAQNAGATLEIIDSNTILLTYNGEVKKVSNIRLDLSKSPVWFDFSAQDTSSTIQVKSILELHGDTVMKWQLFVDEERSPHFTAKKGELLYLKRSKNSTSTTARAN